MIICVCTMNSTAHIQYTFKGQPKRCPILLHLLHRGCRGQDHTPSLPGSRGSAWCCRNPYDNGNQENGLGSPHCTGSTSRRSCAIGRTDRSGHMTFPGADMAGSCTGSGQSPPVWTESCDDTVSTICTFQNHRYHSRLKFYSLSHSCPLSLHSGVLKYPTPFTQGFYCLKISLRGSTAIPSSSRILNLKPHVSLFFLCSGAPSALPRESVSSHQLRILVDLETSLCAHDGRHGAIVVSKQGVEHGKVRHLRPIPAWRARGFARR